jgi:SAM-dependent methyltransferase
MAEHFDTLSSDYYNQGWADTWMDFSRLGPTRRHVRKIVHTLIAPLHFQSVLDVGCGEGSLLNELTQANPALLVAGTDVSEQALKLSRRYLPQGRFSILDLEQSHLDEQADLVICSEVLEHLEADEAAIANLAAMTRRYLVVVVPQGQMRAFEREDVGHVRNYSRAELCTKLENAGFEIFAVVEWGFPFFSPLYRNFLERLPAGAAEGRMGWRKRFAAEMLYRIFELNAWNRGDKLFVLAAQRGGPASL